MEGKKERKKDKQADSEPYNTNSWLSEWFRIRKFEYQNDFEL